MVWVGWLVGKWAFFFCGCMLACFFVVVVFVVVCLSVCLFGLVWAFWRGRQGVFVWLIERFALFCFVSFLFDLMAQSENTDLSIGFNRPKNLGNKSPLHKHPPTPYPIHYPNPKDTKSLVIRE